MNVNDELRSARLRLGLSQWNLAEALGVTQSLVSAWERGAAIPALWALRALVRTLQVERAEDIGYQFGERVIRVPARTADEA